MDAKIPQPVLEVVQALKAGGFQAYLVGGCVRDLLRGEPAKDYDVATSARPEQVQRSFKKVIPTGLQHGTVTVLARGQHVEVTTFRSEGAYLDARRPSTVQFETDIRADLSRRDFTINAMAYDPDAKELVDPFGGQADLAARRIRAVGSALERFTEDGLRPLRAVRFAAVLGFTIDPDTLAAIPAALGSFKKVSLERVRDELSKLLLSSRAASGLQLLRESGMLEVFLPALAHAAEADASRMLRTVERAPAELELRLAALLSPLPPDERALRQLVVDLKFPNKTGDAVARWLSRLPQLPELVAAPDPALRRFLANLGREHLAPLLALARASGADLGQLDARLTAILAARPPLDPKELALDGKAIMERLGVGPSPRVGQAARYLMDQVLDDPSKNTPAALSELLAAWTPK